MTDEITKLYKKAGIKPQKNGYCDWDCDCPYPDCECGDNCPYWKYEDKATLPPFTAEKQLELIKWLAQLDMLNIVRTTREDKAWMMSVYQYLSRELSFAETLAKLINKLWQDLTEQEQEQIKEILE